MIGKGLTEMALVSVIILPFTNDPIALTWYSWCIVLAFALRLAMERQDKTLTFEGAVIQCIYTVCWSMFVTLMWFTFLNFGKGFEVYLFSNALFAAFMVGQLKNIVYKGVPAMLSIWLNRLLAREKEKEETKNV